MTVELIRLSLIVDTMKNGYIALNADLEVNICWKDKAVKKWVMVAETCASQTRFGHLYMINKLQDMK